MRRLKKIAKIIFYTTLILLLIIIIPMFSFRKESNQNPLPSNYKKGVYHFHSIFSDGKGTLDEITKAASELKLDFAILTDHGNPNLKASMATAWVNNVLLIGGSELSSNAGHLAMVGYKIPDYYFPPEPAEAIREINRDSGITFISHPFDEKIPWTDWDIADFTGIEVMSAYSSARKAGILKLILFPIQYLLNSDYAVLNMLEYPRKNIKKWDSLNKTGKYYGIFCTDAHAKLPISKRFEFNFPSYKSMFRIFSTYVKIDKNLGKEPLSASRIIISAIKKGKFFNVIEALASANGFDTYFEPEPGKIIDIGGSSNMVQGNLVAKVPFDFETHITVIKDGEMYKKISRNTKKVVTIPVVEPGAYRLEIFISNNTFNTLPWILTNPIFIGVQYNTPLPLEPKTKIILAEKPNFFSVETNASSTGTISSHISDTGELITDFAFKLEKEPDKKDFWSALAYRENTDFSNHSGFVFEARGEKKIRFWLEFRTNNKTQQIWYRHSFLVEKNWKKYQIPFDKFYVHFGDKIKPDLSKISAIFFAINNAIAYTGTKGNIQLKNIGLY
jgi:hypothetical protein